jgi:hypothetical protein
LLHVGRNPVRRPDLVKRSGNEDYRWSGFLFGGAAEEISVTRGSAIRVFALSRGGNATELEH